MLLKSVLECSMLKVSRWKVDHNSDTEDNGVVELSSEDEAEGLPATPRVARHRFGGPAPVPVPLEPHLAEDEVVVKKRALKQVKQQVLALLCGEDLPKGAQAREVTDIPCAKFLLSPEIGKTVRCARSLSRPTTIWWYTWGFTMVRNSHVVSVGRC